MDAALPLPRTVFRTIGRDSPWNRIGIGVMDKRGISVDHGEYQPATWSLVYVLRGRGTYQAGDGRQWPLEPGSCFQRIPGRVHSTHLVPDSGWVEAFLDLGPVLHRTLATMQVLTEEPPVWMWGLSGERIARFTDLIDDLAEAGEARLPALCVRLLGLGEVVDQVSEAGDALAAQAPHPPRRFLGEHLHGRQRPVQDRAEVEEGLDPAAVRHQVGGLDPAWDALEAAARLKRPLAPIAGLVDAASAQHIDQRPGRGQVFAVVDADSAFVHHPDADPIPRRVPAHGPENRPRQGDGDVHFPY